MKRRFINWRFIPSLTLAGIVCSTMPGFAQDEPLFPDDPVSAEFLADTDDTTASTSEPATDASEPAESVVPAEDSPNPSIILNGKVWRTKPGIVFLKTPLGLLSLSSKTTLKDLLASHEISFWVHNAHLAIDIRKRSDNALIHRYLSGPFKQSNNGENKLIQWTPAGEKTFDFGTYARTLSKFQEDDPVTVEVNESDTIIGIHDLQFDLQVGQVPHEGSSAHLLLTGTVAKLKSNFIFLRTPIGVVNINTKIGIKGAKIGQTLTLHIHDRNVVADLTATNGDSATHRFVTGPLEFASPDHMSVRLWTPDGEQIYPTDSGKTSLSGVKEGSPITIELNGQGHIIEFHQLK